MRIFKTFVSALFFMMVFAVSTNAQQENKNGDVYFIVEEMPKYPGSDNQLREDIAKEVKYPEVAKKNGIEGKVYITFTVNEQGKITNAKIARGVDPSLDKEALRVVSSLDKSWTPGKEKGKAVKVVYTVPINFALESGKASENKKVASKKEGDVYFIVDEMPEFPGGDKALRTYIANSVKYPDMAKKNGIQGKVYVSFIVDVDGAVTGVRIVRGVDPLLDKESVRVIKSLPTWKPGMEKGEAVKVSYTVPINFALS